GCLCSARSPARSLPNSEQCGAALYSGSESSTVPPGSSIGTQPAPERSAADLSADLVGSRPPKCQSGTYRRATTEDAALAYRRGLYVRSCSSCKISCLLLSCGISTSFFARTPWRNLVRQRGICVN